MTLRRQSPGFRRTVPDRVRATRRPDTGDKWGPDSCVIEFVVDGYEEEQ